MSLLRTTIFLVFLLHLLPGFAQNGYTSWIVGDTADASGMFHKSGVVLAGGGGDNDDAMKWMLKRADGGDALIIRASGSDGYNPYFFSELGITFNSVETIRFDDAQASFAPYVLRRLAEAEVLFIAGGDQFDYYTFWKDTPVEDTLNHLILEKQITVGGTSAGMAILGQGYYTPSDLGVRSEEALSNPFHPYLDIIGHNDFLQTPFLDYVITDTHFEQRDRQGRAITFLARLSHLTGERAFGIACNEYTAVAIDEQGTAYTFGGFPEFEDYAFFMQVNCTDDFMPEQLTEGQPLDWNKDQAAVLVYKIPGTSDGANQFDVSNWESGNGGSWENWWVDNGTLQIAPGEGSTCQSATSTTALNKVEGIQYNFQMQTGYLIFHDQLNRPINKISIFDAYGREVLNTNLTNGQVDCNQLISGFYGFTIQVGQNFFGGSFVK